MVDFLASNEGSVLHYVAATKNSDTLGYLLEGPRKHLNRNALLWKGDKSTPHLWAARAARPEDIGVLCCKEVVESSGNNNLNALPLLTAKDVEGVAALRIWPLLLCWLSVLVHWQRAPDYPS